MGEVIFYESIRQISRQLHLKSSCEKCGTYNNLTIHHILPIRELNIHGRDKILASENCMTVCRPCHDRLEGVPMKYYRAKIGRRLKL